MGEDTRARGPRRSYYNVQRDSASNANFSFNVFFDLLPIATRLLAPSGALVFFVGYYIPSAAQQATFSDLSNSSDSKVKVKVKGPNMCYIFEKHEIQGYRI